MEPPETSLQNKFGCKLVSEMLRSKRMTCVLKILSTGLRGGLLYSLEAVVHFADGALSISSHKPSGLLHTENPANVGVPPRQILGSTNLLLVFPPESKCPQRSSG